MHASVSSSEKSERPRNVYVTRKVRWSGTLGEPDWSGAALSYRKRWTRWPMVGTSAERAEDKGLAAMGTAGTSSAGATRVHAGRHNGKTMWKIRSETARIRG